MKNQPKKTVGFFSVSADRISAHGFLTSARAYRPTRECLSQVRVDGVLLELPTLTKLETEMLNALSLPLAV